MRSRRTQLSLRKRGDRWYAFGVIRFGKERREVPEFSTGCAAFSDAEDAAILEEDRVREELRIGPEGTARKAQISEILLAYAGRPEGHAPGDTKRIDELGKYIGDRRVMEAASAWDAFCRMRCADLAPATTDRFRVVLVAALRRHCDGAGIAVPKIATLTYHNEIMRYLMPDEARRLLRAYSRPARDVARFLAGTGCRTQEALRLTWRHVDLASGHAFFPAANTKAKRGRSVPLGPAMRAMLRRIRAVRYKAAMPPADDPVFRSARGEAYGDTRGQGGNPLAQAHATACRRAGVKDFRVHDWRHHAASWAVMNGMSVPALMEMFGWTSPRMVQRYVALRPEYLAEQARRVG